MTRLISVLFVNGLFVVHTGIPVVVLQVVRLRNERVCTHEPAQAGVVNSPVHVHARGGPGARPV